MWTPLPDGNDTLRAFRGAGSPVAPGGFGVVTRRAPMPVDGHSVDENDFRSVSPRLIGGFRRC